MGSHILWLRFKGTGLLGTNPQPQGPTVFSHLKEALGKLGLSEIPFRFGSRLDAGVHAKVFPVVFFEGLSEKWARALPLALNTHLPPQIRAIDVGYHENVNHGRHEALSKTYRYYFYGGNVEDPFWDETAFHARQFSQISQGKERLQRTCKLFNGDIDLKHFDIASGKKHVTTIRRMDGARVVVRANLPWFIEIQGAGFLKQAVRALAGTMLSVAIGKISEKQFQDLLQGNGEKSWVGPVLPARGLWLYAVNYGSPSPCK